MRRAEAHHTARRRAATALLLVDFLQRYSGRDGASVLAQLEPRLAAVVRLRAAARRARVPVIYVNDHLGMWRGNQDELIARAERGRGQRVIEALRPGRRDLFVLKPNRSAFFQTPLESLLNGLGVKRLVVAGVATDVCVLATASDAVMRKLRCHVPADACAAVDEVRHNDALRLMERSMDVPTRPSAAVRW